MADEEVLYERGKPIKNREDLALLQWVVQDDMARSLKKIELSQKREQFEGKVDEKGLICTGTSKVLNLLKEHPYSPWAKVYFQNKGPDTALVSINNAYDWNAIEADGDLEMDFLKADKRIEVIHYKCNVTGETATITATGKW